MRFKLCALLLVIPLLSSPLKSSATAQQPAPLAPDVLDRVRDIAAAKTPQQAARSYKELLDRADRQMLRQLKHVSETGVALRAALEEVGLTATPERVDPQAVSRFLGFIEGRLDIQLPTWWEETIVSATLDPTGRIVPGFPQRWLTEDSPKDFPELAKLEQTQSRTHTRVQIGKQAVLLTPEVFEMRRKSLANTAGYLDQENCILALHSDSGESYSLLCFDRRTGEIRWKSEVWAGASEFTVIGKSHEIVAVVTKGKRVFVVGSGTFHFYIEGFDRKTGQAEFRFVNFYFPEAYKAQRTRF